MALRTIFRGERCLSVVAFPAERILIHIVHRYPRRAFFHLEDFRMTFATAVFLCVTLMGEIHRHAGIGISKRREVMAVIADVLVEIYLFVRLYYVALVTMHSEGDMLCMREFPRHVFRKLLIGMTFKTGQTGVLQRREHRCPLDLRFRLLSRAPLTGSEHQDKGEDCDYSFCHHFS